MVKMNHTVVDDISSALFKGELNDTELGNVMVAAFNCLHQNDFFYPGQELYPGTYECRFCGLSPSTEDCPSKHVRRCAKLHTLTDTNHAVAYLAEETHISQRCTWYSDRGKQCTKQEFDDSVTWSRHVESHFRTHQLKQGALLRRLYSCQDVNFGSKLALNDHMIEIHRFPSLSRTLKPGKPQNQRRD